MYRSSEKFQSTSLDARIDQNSSSLLDRRSSRSLNLNLSKKTIDEIAKLPSAHITIGARSSPLSKVQVDEVCKALLETNPHLVFKKIFIKTSGDLNKTTPLWHIGETDFFTKELDQMTLSEDLRIAVHSAKDLPNPIPKGLTLLALTKGVDPRESFVMRYDETIESLKHGALIGTSSLRRTETVYKLRPDFVPQSIRGTIHERLEILFLKKVDALIMAQAALIRLNLTHLNHLILSYAGDPLQGRLAIIGRDDDHEMKNLFQTIDARNLP